ncbi:MAG: tRNA pseudouridine synthase A [Acidobacteriota bacterium]
MPGVDDGNAGTVWKLILSYDGTDFHGWQIQPGSPTLQGMLAEAIYSVTGEQVLPQGSGRTDAGVHAWGQVASFALRAAIPAKNLQGALNRILPSAIRILSAERAGKDFHARHSAVGKLYQYRIFPGGICSPFLARYVSVCKWPLDLEAMQAAAEAIVGEHDFTSFAASDPDRTARIAAVDASDKDAVLDEENLTQASNVRRITMSQWTRESALSISGALGAMLLGQGPNFTEAATPEGGEILTYTVSGNGFLHHMVRNLVGTFVEIGRGRMSPADMDRILESRNRSLAGPTAAARGLCLMKVLY